STSPLIASRTCSSARPPISSSRVLSCSSSSWKCRTTRSTGSINPGPRVDYRPAGRPCVVESTSGRPELTESSGNVIFGQFLGGGGKNLIRAITFHQPAEPEECRDV